MAVNVSIDLGNSSRGKKSRSRSIATKKRPRYKIGPKKGQFKPKPSRRKHPRVKTKTRYVTKTRTRYRTRSRPVRNVYTFLDNWGDDDEDQWKKWLLYALYFLLFAGVVVGIGFGIKAILNKKRCSSEGYKVCTDKGCDDGLLLGKDKICRKTCGEKEVIFNSECRESCPDGTVANANKKCVASSSCGAAGQAPCNGQNCSTANLVVVEGVCVECGNLQQPVCSADTCIEGLVNKNKVCLPPDDKKCGGENQPVCPGTNKCLAGFDEEGGECKNKSGGPDVALIVALVFTGLVVLVAAISYRGRNKPYFGLTFLSYLRPKRVTPGDDEDYSDSDKASKLRDMIYSSKVEAQRNNDKGREFDLGVAIELLKRVHSDSRFSGSQRDGAYNLIRDFLEDPNMDLDTLQANFQQAGVLVQDAREDYLAETIASKFKLGDHKQNARDFSTFESWYQNQDEFKNITDPTLKQRIETRLKNYHDQYIKRVSPQLNQAEQELYNRKLTNSDKFKKSKISPVDLLRQLPQVMKDSYTNLGKNIEKAPQLLVSGPPGVGKTAFINAWASEKNPNEERTVLTIDNADISNKFGADAVVIQSMFRIAQNKMMKNPPEKVVIFIDEADEIFKLNEQHINSELGIELQKLMELNPEVSVVLNTNYEDKIKRELPALYNRLTKVSFGKPNKTERLAQLNKHIGELKLKIIPSNEEIEKVAEKVKFSHRDIVNAAKEMANIEGREKTYEEFFEKIKENAQEKKQKKGFLGRFKNTEK